jgi:CHAD domain-containing protein
MSYELTRNETPAEGIKRIITEQIDRAIASLEPPLDDPDEAIHDARKRFKKIRAAVRLVRDEIGSDVYHRENRFFRDLGRRLAPMRDSYVNLRTLGIVMDTYSGKLAPDAFDPLREQLKQVWQDTSTRLIEDEGAHLEIVEALREARDRIQDLPISDETFEAFEDGLARVYERGVDGLDDAYEHPEPEMFHDWRKRVKYLWYHTRILEPLWEDVVDEYGDAAHDLADYLGDAHDFAELRALIHEADDLPIDDAARRALLAVLDAERGELERSAWKLGQRIYAEDEDAFIARHARYWEIWKAPDLDLSREVVEARD